MITDPYYLQALKASYYNALVSKIQEVEASAEENTKIEQRLLDIWLKNLEIKIDQRILEFSSNLKTTYMLTDEELKEVFQKSINEYVSYTVTDLSNKNVIRPVIDQSGEIIYELTN